MTTHVKLPRTLKEFYLASECETYLTRFKVVTIANRTIVETESYDKGYSLGWPSNLNVHSARRVWKSLRRRKHRQVLFAEFVELRNRYE